MREEIIDSDIQKLKYFFQKKNDGTYYEDEEIAKLLGKKKTIIYQIRHDLLKKLENEEYKKAILENYPELYEDMIDIRIDELNKKIKTNMRKTKLCDKLIFTGTALSIVATSPIILKNPNYMGATLYLGAALSGMGGSVFIGSKASDKYDAIINDCVNEIHGYALEKNKDYVKKTIDKK